MLRTACPPTEVFPLHTWKYSRQFKERWNTAATELTGFDVYPVHALVTRSNMSPLQLNPALKGKDYGWMDASKWVWVWLSIIICRVFCE